MSKTDRFDRDWLPVATGMNTDQSVSGIGADISNLHDFLCGKPTDTKQIRAAVVRILRSRWDTMGYGRTLICKLFDRNCAPEGWAPAWTVDFKRIDGGQSHLSRDIKIAAEIQAVRDCGKSYNQAIEWAVEQYGLGTRRMQQIYGEHKDKFGTRHVNVRRIKEKFNLKD